jgi:cytochrome c peroxidase
MWWREWSQRPELAKSFLAGYGRELSDEDRVRLAGTSAVGHLIAIIWATNLGIDRFAAESRTWLRRQQSEGLEALA